MSARPRVLSADWWLRLRCRKVDIGMFCSGLHMDAICSLSAHEAGNVNELQHTFTCNDHLRTWPSSPHALKPEFRQCLTYMCHGSMRADALLNHLSAMPSRLSRATVMGICRLLLGLLSVPAPLKESAPNDNTPSAVGLTGMLRLLLS